MFCPQCGNNLGTEKSCSRCGWSEGGEIIEDYTAPAQEPDAEPFGGESASENTSSENTSPASPFIPAPAAENAGQGGASAPFVTLGQIRAMLASPLMLTLCVLSSACAFFGLISGRVNIFAILYAIAFWLAYASARGTETEMKTGGLKMTYYVSKALMIVMWVAVGLVALGAVLASLGAMFGASIPSFRIFGSGFDFLPRFDGSFYGLAYGIEFPFDAAMISASLFFILLAFGLLVACVLMVIVQIFYIRSLCRFTRSLYSAALDGRGTLIKLKAARQWTFVLGILSCLSIFGVGYDLGQNLAALSGACGGAAMIVCAVMLKNFLATPASDTNM